MNKILHTFTLVTMFALFGCDKPMAAHDTDQKSKPGQYGDEGIQREKDKPIDEKIQIEPPNPNGNPPIIIPPPKVNMPADIVPEKPTN